eukprot:g16607.t1
MSRDVQRRRAQQALGRQRQAEAQGAKAIAAVTVPCASCGEPMCFRCGMAMSEQETLALAFDGVRRVLSHFSEQAGAEAFAPLAYAMLLQVQEGLGTLGSEISTSAIRALTDLMRIPSALQMFEVDLLTLDERLPLPGGVQQTSVWLLSWRVLWRLVNHCLRICWSRSLPPCQPCGPRILRVSRRCSI